MKIGAVDYDIIELPNLKDGSEELNGQIKYNDMEIHLNSNLENAPKAITLLHEIFHAILLISGWKQSELMVEMLANNMYQVLKDNHVEIMKYIEPSESL